MKIKASANRSVLGTASCCALALSVLLSASPQAEASQRQALRLVGSSTMYNMSAEVSERFGAKGRTATPVVESTGTGGGFKQFCAGIGDDTPDIVAASRLITDEEQALCEQNDVGPVLEFPVGTGGLVLVNSREQGPLFNFTRQHIWKALAATVPVNGTLQPNPYRNWHEIDPILPDLPITVYGPPLTSGTRDALVGMVIEPLCLIDPVVTALPHDQQRETCMKLREDGAYIDAGEDDDTLLRRVAANPKAVAVVGFHALTDDPSLKAAPIDGVQPSAVSLMSGTYPLIRDLLVYVKGDHLQRLPGLADFVRLYVSDEMIGPNGRLIEDGLIPLPQKERAEIQQHAAELKGIDR